MSNIFSELYHGNLRPFEHDYSTNRDYSILADSFKQDKGWLLERLNDKERGILSDLLQVHDELNHLIGYESFRDGFILGACLVMEVSHGADEICDG